MTATMKGSLYASTAICAVALLHGQTARADGIELGLSGFTNTLFSAGGINATGSRDYGGDVEPDYNATGLWADGEVHFLGSYKHDNGITFGANIEMEIFASSTSDDTISQHYIYVEGDFGRIEAGSRDSAAYQMHYAAPVVGLPINSGWVTVFIPANGDSAADGYTPAISTYIDFGNQENTLTYYTPRIQGFQLGLSYAPSVSFSGDGQNFPVEADRNTQYSNGFSVGANYVEEFGELGVALSVGYSRSEVSDDLSSMGADDYQGIALGANFSYAGVTIGGAYANAFDGLAYAVDDPISGGTNLHSLEGQSWNVGLAYNTGPWTVGGEYFQGEVEGYVPGYATNVVGPGNDDKLYAATGGVSYALGPGIDLIGGVMYGRWSAESGAVNTGVIAAGGITLNF